MKISNPMQRSIERVVIAVTAVTYLTFFNRTLPHGDALRIVRQIEQSTLEWNPNHLLFDPLGHGIYSLLSIISPGITMLGSFEILSGAATLLSLLLFHSILLQVGIERTSIRLLGTAGIWASQSFLSQSTSQYYFMIQMPFLLGTIYLYFNFMLYLRAGEIVYCNLYFMGLLLAFSAAIMFNNCFIIFFSGIGVGLTGTSWKQLRMEYSLRLWAAAAIVGVPIFIAGYLLSRNDHGFFVWLLSYAGDATSKLNKLYGIKASISSVIAASIGVVYQTILGSILKIPGFGNVIMKGFISKSSLEFIPDYRMIASNIILAPAIIALNIRSCAFIVQRIRHDASVRFLALWIGAYIAFNFYWTAGDDIFWFQIIPAIWLLILMAEGFMTAIRPDNENNLSSSGPNKWGWYLIILLVPLLFLVNTKTVVLPFSGSGYYANQARHEALFRKGDLEIIPGWDSQKWMMSSKDAPAVRKIVLMNAALAPDDSPDSIKKLDEIVGNHIRIGQRVIVARLYDLDHDLMPWYALKEMGWPRKRIQGLLSAYCNRPIAEIDGVKFRQLYACPSSEKTRSPAAGAPRSQDTMERSDTR